MPMKSMNDLFIHGLKDIYYAEKQILKALPKMMKETKSTELKQAFEKHLEETHEQVQRLEKVFQACNVAARGIKCDAIEGLIQEAQDMIDDVEDEEVLDAAILSNGQAVEHYEIARYGTLIAWANQLGMNEVTDLLRQSLEEEKRTNRLLTELAESQLNPLAAESGAQS